MPRTYMESGATFSPCRQYRYRLWRYWDESSRPLITFIMLNPSSADENSNDPTVDRCERRARAMGYGGLEVVNLFAYCSPDPKIMKRQTDPVGPDNDSAIQAAAMQSGLVICAWGVDGNYLGRDQEVIDLLRPSGVPLHCLKITTDGHPAHPLYVGYEVVPSTFVGKHR